MLPNDPTQFNWFESILYACLAGIGGILGHILRVVDAEEKINWLRAALEGIAAGFVGMLILFSCKAMHMPEPWTGVIVGVSGWLGARASIRLLEKVIYKKLGITEGGADEPPKSSS